MKKKICVVIPCYNVKRKILSVINSRFLKKVDKIIIVDDNSQDNSVKFIENINDNRIKIISNKEYQNN